MTRVPPNLTAEEIRKFREALAFVEGFSSAVSLPRGSKNSGRPDPGLYIRRTRKFLKLVGSPDKRLKFIHITGTAGKGTVSNMIHNTLVANGLRVGLFTSPYSTSAIERIKVGKLYIAPKEFVRIVRSLRKFFPGGERNFPGAPSVFELFLIIALIYFKEKRCEWVILEVGVGGRYDATNFVKAPKITAITNIDFDHTKLLGRTLRQIALDKGGIIKKGAFFLTTETRPSLRAIFKKLCRENGASFTNVPTLGDYREGNRSLAREISHLTGVSEAGVKKGLKEVVLPCRFEIIARKPLVILDGAHNRVKMKSVLKNLKTLPYKRLFLLLALANDNRDTRPILELIVPLAEKIVLTRVLSARGGFIHPKALLPRVEKIKKRGAEASIILDPQEALDFLLVRARPSDAILVTGSFFLAGEIRKRWYPEKFILNKRKSF